MKQTVGGAPQSARLEIHEQEGEIVEHVAAGDRVGEFDGVEEDRLAVDQRDVAQVKIAVAAPDQPARPRLSRTAAATAKARRVSRVRRRASAGAKEVGLIGEGRVVLLDISLELVGAADPVAQRGAAMRRTDREREPGL